MEPGDMVRLGSSTSPRLAGIGVGDASETVVGAEALTLPAHERVAGGDAGAVAPGPTAESAEAEQWDRFVMRVPGGDLVQTEVWAQAKRLLGLETCRVVLREGDRITGGAQIVLKRFGQLGAVGYVARGPLTAGDRPPDVGRVMEQVERAARARRVRHLIVQAAARW
jgi:FemAB family